MNQILVSEVRDNQELNVAINIDITDHAVI